jgi:hypothetical protein
MADGIHATDDGLADLGDFAREVRRLAADAHRILKCPDSPIDELIGLHGRVFRLLDAAQGARSNAILCWLLAVRQRIGARLESWSMEELDSWEA